MLAQFKSNEISIFVLNDPTIIILLLIIFDSVQLVHYLPPGSKVLFHHPRKIFSIFKGRSILSNWNLPLTQTFLFTVFFSLILPLVTQTPPGYIFNLKMYGILSSCYSDLTVIFSYFFGCQWQTSLTWFLLSRRTLYAPFK